MAKNFKGQNLQGQSFKGENLTGADFSNCDLRGVDFSMANLTDATFCNATMGRTKKTSIAILIFQFFISIFGLLMTMVGMTFITFIISKITNLSPSFENLTYFDSLISLIYAVIFITLLLWTLVKERWETFILFLVLTLIIAGFGGEFEIENLGKTFGSVFAFSFMTLWGISSLIIVAIMTIAVTSTISVIIILGFSVIILYLIIVDLASTPFVVDAKLFMYLIVMLNTLFFAIVSTYIGKRALTKEEPQLLLLRDIALRIACWQGTEFAFATLRGVNFSGTDLRYARFSNSHINNCIFKDAKNHHLCLTSSTPLAPRKVRDIAIDGVITDTNFATLDLRGLDFSGLDLRNFDFSHTNLSGTNLSHTQLTGAILEGWNIDTETNLADIECRYYIYFENGAKKRMPPEGEEYGAGEFTRIFQKIANTIDFIAHNEMELVAINLSVDQVRVESGNDAIRVQAIEEKEGFIVVKVTAPTTEDRGVLYHEVNSKILEYEAKIQALTMDKHIQIGTIEILKEQIKEQRNDFLATIKQQEIIQIGHHEGGIIMNNSSRHFSGNNNNNINLGNNSTLINTIQEIPVEHNELKALLEELQTLIDKSSLSEGDKKEALSETKTIAESVEKPKEEQETIIRKTLRYFKGLSSDLESGTEIANKFITTVTAIGKLFGI